MLRKLDEWRDEVRSWRCSAQSAEEYAAGHDLNQGTLLWWSCRLRKEQGVRPARRREPTTETKPAFLAVKVRETQVPQAKGDLEVVLGNGRRVRVSGDFDSDRVARLLAVVEGRPLAGSPIYYFRKSSRASAAAAELASFAPPRPFAVAL